MSRTARSIITSALTKLGAAASGETPSASMIQDGLLALQGLLDSWSLNDLLSYTETKETLTLVGGQQVYTIGTDGDFNTTRPVAIIGMSVVEDGTLEIPLAKRTLEQWESIGLKSTQSDLPTEFYFRTTWPLGEIHIFPVPTSEKTIRLISRKPLITVSSANTEIDLPHGYIDALIYNLCIELADEYGGQLTESIISLAERKLSAIKTQNLSKSIPYLATDGEFSGSNGRSGATLADFMRGGR